MNCTFCGSAIEAGTGKMYVKRDASVYHFCSSKCQRNMVELGRVNRHVGWTQAYADHKGDRLTASEVLATKAKVKATAKAASKAPAKAAAKPVKAE